MSYRTSTERSSCKPSANLSKPRRAPLLVSRVLLSHVRTYVLHIFLKRRTILQMATAIQRNDAISQGERDNTFKNVAQLFWKWSNMGANEFTVWTMQSVRVAPTIFKRSDKPNTVSHCPCIHLICIYINDAGALCCKVRSNERTWIRLLFSFWAFDSLDNNFTLLESFPCSRGEAGSGSAKPLLSGCFLFHFHH